MKHLLYILIIILLGTHCIILENQQPFPSEENFTVGIPTAGNSWVMDNNGYISSDLISSEGVRNWSNNRHIIRTFFYVEKIGEISLGLKSRVSNGASKLKISLGNESREISVNNTDFEDISIGRFQIESVGYYFIDIFGLEKSGDNFPDINEVLIGDINENEVKYTKDEFYWSRRGPSVHLNYEIPDEVGDVEWFYSELLIPEEQDVIGSYFMANGFNHGYFGIQVNSSTERRILFSIWSPFQTDNPSEIPEKYKIKLLKKGNGVTTGEFGNEGSGGQSYKVFNWKSGVKYGFLLKAKPDGENNTDYSAYFYDPELSNWSLIAQFRRPDTNTFLTGLYSFLENFIPDTGVYERKGLYMNQWVYDFAGWHELNKVRFTGDNTAIKQNRLDFSGGVENNVFYLKNCGFTNDQTPVNSIFERGKSGKVPIVDFTSLE